jgi:hypothetical protein
MAREGDDWQLLAFGEVWDGECDKEGFPGVDKIQGWDPSQMKERCCLLRKNTG